MGTLPHIAAARYISAVYARYHGWMPVFDRFRHERSLRRFVGSTLREMIRDSHTPSPPNARYKCRSPMPPHLRATPPLSQRRLLTSIEIAVAGQICRSIRCAICYIYTYHERASRYCRYDGQQDRCATLRSAFRAETYRCRQRRVAPVTTPHVPQKGHARSSRPRFCDACCLPPAGSSRRARLSGFVSTSG